MMTKVKNFKPKIMSTKRHRTPAGVGRLIRTGVDRHQLRSTVDGDQQVVGVPSASRGPQLCDRWLSTRRPAEAAAGSHENPTLQIKFLEKFKKKTTTVMSVCLFVSLTRVRFFF